MPKAAFLALRSELLLAATHMSCEQALDLADLLHTSIRMRKPGRPLRNIDSLFREEAIHAYPAAPRLTVHDGGAEEG